MYDRCPGAFSLRTPTLKIRTCPLCGEEVEMFSTDVKMTCSTCGFVIYNNIESCIEWCSGAKDCLGEKTYNAMKNKQLQ